MNTQPQEEKKWPKKHTWTKLLWFKLIFINICGMLVFTWILHALGSHNPFRYASIVAVGIFFLSVIIVSNVKRSKPWSRFNWE